jgi:hypothetical protein
VRRDSPQSTAPEQDAARRVPSARPPASRDFPPDEREPHALVGHVVGVDPGILPIFRFRARARQERKQSSIPTRRRCCSRSSTPTGWARSSASCAAARVQTSPDALVDKMHNCPEVALESDLDLDDKSHLGTAFWILALPRHVMGFDRPRSTPRKCPVNTADQTFWRAGPDGPKSACSASFALTPRPSIQTDSPWPNVPQARPAAISETLWTRRRVPGMRVKP